MRMNAILRRLGLAGVTVLYFWAILEISGQYGMIPRGIYRMAAERTGSTEAAVQQAVSLHAPNLWERGRELGLWEEDGPYTCPRFLLSELLLLVAGEL